MTQTQPRLQQRLFGVDWARRGREHHIVWDEHSMMGTPNMPVIEVSWPYDELSLQEWFFDYFRNRNFEKMVPLSMETLRVDHDVDLRHRLANANDYFRRKAREVLTDDDAVRLLARLYEVGTLDLAEIDTCRDGIPLAKLTAANFCQIGAKVAYITDSGLRFINSIKDA